MVVDPVSSAGLGSLSRELHAPTDANTTALRAFNDHVAARTDCEAVMLSIGDGVTFIRRTA